MGWLGRIVPGSVPALGLICVTPQPLVQQASVFFHPAQAFVHVSQSLVHPPRSLCPPDPLGTQLCVSIAIVGRNTSSFAHRYGPRGVAPYEEAKMRLALL